MTPSFLQSGPSIFLGQQSQKKDWVPSCYDPTTGLSKSKLLFNEAIPARAINRASCVGPPAPIVIERLLPRSEVAENVDDTRSSVSFTALSEERLQAAVDLARRDLRQRRLGGLATSSVRRSQDASLLETSDVEPSQKLAETPEKTKSKASSRKGAVMMRPCTKRHTTEKRPVSTVPRVVLSPPTRDPGPQPDRGGKEGPLSHEIRRLQHELQVFVNKVEALAHKAGEKQEEPLEEEEQAKLENRRKKQAAHSARIIYVLRQQVKEVQEEMERIRSQKTSDSQKTAALNRLAATHRRALRAVQVLNQQLSDVSHSNVPPHHRELGQLLRQLSLCSAKVEVDRGSAVPAMVLDILQKLETLDSALGKQQMVEKMQAQACPPHGESPRRSTSPPAAPRGPGASSVRGHGRTVLPRGRPRAGRTAASRMMKSASHQPPSRRDVLRAAVESLGQQRELREQRRAAQRKHTSRKEADTTKRVQIGDVGFRQPTVSSRLRVAQLPQKESSVPWKPTSPHSPPPRRSPQRERPEPRCLFSPVKLSSSPPTQPAARGVRPEPTLNSEKKKEAQNEALRKAWLDRMTTQRLEELNRLSKEQEERIQRLRSEVVSPTRWAERAEQKARERLRPLLDEAQAAGGGERLSEALLEDLLEDATRSAWAGETDGRLEDAAQRRLQAPTLESMLLRMEEIQKDQDQVRRRFASITYSDPLFWDRPGPAGPLSQAPGSGLQAPGSGLQAPGSRPSSPQPIRLTRPVQQQTSAADIVLEKPLETGFQLENSLTEEEVQGERRRGSGAVFPAPLKGHTVLSVPGSMLGDIRQNRELYDSYLRAVAQQEVGSLNRWTVAESVADELLSEALADVAAEFQDVTEEYAAAVFTSEFLQPIQTPPTSAAVSQ